MLKLILPVVLIGIAIAGFLVFTGPLFQDLVVLRGQVASYNEALDNSKKLENERDLLTQQYNKVNPENLAKLEKFLPDSVDNIRLILEIEEIAKPYGMALQDVRYDVLKDAGTSAEAGGNTTSPTSGKEYGTWELYFSTQGTYSNFVNFLKDLERNLRVVDVSSVQFLSNVGGEAKPGFTEVYKYGIRIKTYWLKN